MLTRREWLGRSAAGIATLAWGAGARAGQDETDRGRLIVMVSDLPGPIPVNGKLVAKNGHGFGFSGPASVDPTDGSWVKLEIPSGEMRHSPDRKRLAIVTRGRKPEDSGLFVVDLKKPEPRRISDLDGWRGWQPAWSPDSRSILVTVHDPNPADRLNRAGKSLRIAADGSKSEAIELPPGSDIYGVLPDGEHLLILSRKPAEAGARPEYVSEIVGQDGKTIRILSEHPGFCARSSPDGRQILYTERTDDGNTLWIEPTAGGERTPIEVGKLRNVEACWSPDGRSIAVSSHRLSRRGPGGGLGFGPDDLLDSSLEIIELEGERRRLPMPTAGIRVLDWI